MIAPTAGPTSSRSVHGIPRPDSFHYDTNDELEGCTRWKRPLSRAYWATTICDFDYMSVRHMERPGIIIQAGVIVETRGASGIEAF